MLALVLYTLLAYATVAVLAKALTMTLGAGLNILFATVLVARLAMPLPFSSVTILFTVLATLLAPIKYVY